MVQTKKHASQVLCLELKKIKEEPVEGFLVKLVNDDNMFKWEVAIFGPPETIYEGAYLKARMKFPKDFPFSPPKFRFISKVWHPNVHPNGDLCISILHSPVNDPTSGELSGERWSATQGVRTVLISVISLLNEPNVNSPANVDAAKMFRRWIESKGEDKEYEDEVKKVVEASKLEAEKDGVVVPITVEDYCVQTPKRPAQVNVVDFEEDYSDYESDDEDESEDESEQEDESEDESEQGEEISN